MRSLENVTITLEETVARWARLEAARENTSVSRFVGDILAARMRDSQAYDVAMERYLSVNPRAISNGRPCPTRGELYDRAGECRRERRVDGRRPDDDGRERRAQGG